MIDATLSSTASRPLPSPRVTYRALSRRDSAYEGVLFTQRIDTPLGAMLALADDQGLRLLEFTDRRGLEREIAEWSRELRCAVAPGENAALRETRRQLARYFAGESLEFDLPLAPAGSAFQMRVWRELQKIPPGETRSYAQLARAVGAPGAARAVGRANGSNRLAIVIPCHRVINAGGAPGGYAGGVWRKKRLLDHEQTHRK